MPWIKWHKKCLRDDKFLQLTDAESWTFVGLILLAMETKNKIPADFPYISRIISHSTKGFAKKMLKLVDLELIVIKRIAKGYQDDSVDTDTDVDKDKDIYKEADKKREEIGQPFPK